jgi:hypothetical protein
LDGADAIWRTLSNSLWSIQRDPNQVHHVPSLWIVVGGCVSNPVQVLLHLRSTVLFRKRGHKEIEKTPSSVADLPYAAIAKPQYDRIADELRFQPLKPLIQIHRHAPTICLLVFPTGVMNVIDAVDIARGD